MFIIVQETQETAARMTNDDVLGDKIPDQQEFQLRRFCCDMLKTGQVPGFTEIEIIRERQICRN